MVAPYVNIETVKNALKHRNILNANPLFRKRCIEAVEALEAENAALKLENERLDFDLFAYRRVESLGGEFDAEREGFPESEGQ